MFVPLYIIYGVITIMSFWILPIAFPYYGFLGNVLMTIPVSFIICTPITLLYMILLELKEIKDLKEEEIREIREIQKIQKKSKRIDKTP